MQPCQASCWFPSQGLPDACLPACMHRMLDKGTDGWMGVCIFDIQTCYIRLCMHTYGCMHGDHRLFCGCLCVCGYQSRVYRQMIRLAYVHSLPAKHQHDLAAKRPLRQRHARLFRSMAAAMLPAAAGANCQAHPTMCDSYPKSGLRLGFAASRVSRPCPCARGGHRDTRGTSPASDRKSGIIGPRVS